MSRLLPRAARRRQVLLRLWHRHGRCQLQRVRGRAAAGVAVLRELRHAALGVRSVEHLCVAGLGTADSVNAFLKIEGSSVAANGKADTGLYSLYSQGVENENFLRGVQAAGPRDAWLGRAVSTDGT